MTKTTWSCDFETTTDPLDCRTWVWGKCEIGNETNFSYGTNFDDFMSWCMTGNKELYFHNLKFDGSFIANWLLSNGYKWVKKPMQVGEFSTLISKHGSWYSLEIVTKVTGKKKKVIQKTVIYDSLKKLPYSASYIAKSFMLPILKGEIDYHKPRPLGYVPTVKEIDYLKNDVQIIALALEKQFDSGLTKMTAGSDAMGNFKDMIGDKLFKYNFPQFSLEMDTDIRQAYRGGFTWLHEKYKGVDIRGGIVFDVNSLYPSVMYNEKLPYGTPLTFEGKYVPDPQYPLYIQQIEVDFKLKENHIPTIQIKQNKYFAGNEYLHDTYGTGSVILTLTNVDLQLFLDHYDIIGEIEYLKGYKFKAFTGAFKNYIDKWLAQKIAGRGAVKEQAKLMLNSLYGKFATNPDVTGKVPKLVNGVLTFEDGETDYKDPVYTAMGCFITAYARNKTISTAQKCYSRIIYCDTDSIHLTGTDIPDAIKDEIDPNILGYWKHESTFSRARFLRQKTYIEDISCDQEHIEEGMLVSYPFEGKQHEVLEVSDDSLFLNGIGEVPKNECYYLNVKCAGMAERVKSHVTYDNFRVNFSAEGNLKLKQVKGGAVLIDSLFQIKEFGTWKDKLEKLQEKECKEAGKELVR